MAAKKKKAKGKTAKKKSTGRPKLATKHPVNPNLAKRKKNGPQ